MWKPTWLHREFFSIRQYLSFLFNDSCKKCGVYGSVVDLDPELGGQQLPTKSEEISCFEVLNAFF
jgi:hypothetical protein